ncbi:MAG: hypothetical protein V7785_12770 [Bermanella sp.]
MKSFCIYCGNSKPEAHEICGSCDVTPETHEDLIYSIIMCYSADEPYLNFLSFEEIEALCEEIGKGEKIKVKPEVFAQAKEAYSAVRSLGSPPILNKFSRYSSPINIVILVLVLLGLIFGA